MKKARLVPIVFLLFGCSSNNKKELYYQQLEKLNSHSYVTSNKLAFSIDGTSTLYKDNISYKIEIMFLEAKERLEDIAILMLDERINDATISALNVGFFNEDTLNLVPVKEKDGDQTKVRFTFISDLEKPTMKIAFSYKNSNTRQEIFYDYNWR